RLAAKYLDPSRGRQHVGIGALVDDSHEGRERFGITVDDARAIDDECGDSRRPAVSAPGGNGNVGRRWLRGDDEPQHVGRAGRESRGETSEELAKRCTPIELDEERAECAGSVRDEGG